MKVKGTDLGLLVLVGALLAPLAVAAQGGPGPGPGGPGPGGRMGGMMGGPGRMFDPKTVTTVQGQIAAVERIDRGHGHRGVHLTLTSGPEKLAVHLGPDFYVDAQSLKLAVGDQVEVKGSKIDFQGKPAIIAQEVRRGGEVLALRGPDGVPLWRGQGMGRR